MHGIVWMVIGHSGTCYRGIQSPRQCMVYFIFYILWVTPAWVWCCDASTVTEHENHQTSNINIKYSGEHNKRQCPDHSQTFTANSCVCVVSSHLNDGRQIRWKYQTGSHRISHPPSFCCCACLYFYREKDSDVPLLRRP